MCMICGLWRCICSVSQWCFFCPRPMDEHAPGEQCSPEDRDWKGEGIEEG